MAVDALVTENTTATVGTMVTEGITMTEGSIGTDDTMVTIGTTMLAVTDKVRVDLKTDLGYRLTYNGFIPVLIIVGIFINATCIVVLRRPAFIPFQVNRYFQLLAWGDLVLCLAYLPITVSTNGCILYQYWFAWYFAHFGWSVPFGVHAFCTYTLTWLALDRCLAVWWHQAFTTIQQPHLQQWRAVGTAAFCLAVHMPVVVEAEVSCSAWGLEHEDTHCENGTWLTTDVFHGGGSSYTRFIFIRLYNIMVRWSPDLLLAAFNLSLVVAVWQGRVHSQSSRVGQQDGRTWERSLVLTMMTMATFYISLTLPITLVQTRYTTHSLDQCHTSNPQETLRQVGHCLQLLEHIIHPIFLACFNPTFRRELQLTFNILGLEARLESVTITGGISDSQL
ncbi:hypothetical protein Pcinc_012547 [Petrolisthes cinctipes]|uniref:G-protein coupled receptors family 1 profile domain-containing protein n=1 Tax=Petrolisthes cinctipes TaxID=88211 RepID=A0AAE1KSG6_PETCI|nr:hypothetical protein Pcinc_012547 [Petrolisthes cinctipes]